MVLQDQKTLIDPIEVELFLRGVHYELYDVLGAHVKRVDGVVGTHFALWAKNAKAVFLAGDFNGWDPKSLPMVKNTGGIWELFVPEVGFGAHYKYVIETESGEMLWKSDPVAFSCQMRPETASIVQNVDDFEWSEWKFEKSDVRIYEVHLGSWRKGLDYRALAKELVEYCLEMGFTHVELLPITEHPLDESWGYQVSGFFAPTARFGKPEDFQYFVDYMHKNGIGVILDWVPSHFPMDEFALAKFDGTPLFEYSDKKMGYHPQWDTYIFDYASARVRNFLMASALFWFDKYNVDGLRVDAMESIIMRDFGKNGGEWIPNKVGGRENEEAIEFLRHLNSIVKERFPGRIMSAEDSSMHKGVTHAFDAGGLGFDYKWGLGWMHDTLDVFTADFDKRDLSKLTHIFTYIQSEHFILPLSHDEVVHGKKSLLEKMPGDDFEKRAGVRMLLAWVAVCPGESLLFMGSEFGQKCEWDCMESLRWDEKDEGLIDCVKALNAMKIEGDLGWEQDGFLSVQRGKTRAIFNFGLEPIDVQIPEDAFSTDSERFGGKGRGGLPPLSAVIYG